MRVTSMIAALGMLAAATVPALAMPATQNTDVKSRSNHKWEFHLQAVGAQGGHECRRNGNNADLVRFIAYGDGLKDCTALPAGKYDVYNTETLAWLSDEYALCPWARKDCSGGDEWLFKEIQGNQNCWPYGGWQAYSVVKKGIDCVPFPESGKFEGGGKKSEVPQSEEE